MRWAIVVVWCVCVLGVARAEASDPVGGLYALAESDKPLQLMLDWCRESMSEDQQCPTLPAAFSNYKKIKRGEIPRVSPEQEVFLTILNLNYFRFQLELKEDVKEIESYKELAKIVGRFSALGVSAKAAEPFADQVKQWKVLLADYQKVIKDQLAQLPDDQVVVDKKLSDQLTFSTEDKIKSLEEAREAAFAAAKTLDELRFYEALLPLHEHLIQSLADYKSRYDLATGGKTYRIKGKDVGSYVTLSFVVSDASGKVRQSDVSEVSYLVETKMPLIFHGGFSYAKVNDVEFKQVRSLGGDDLFQKVKDDPGSTGLTVFLGYPLATWDDKGGWQTLLSLGTNVDKPGEKISLGLSQTLWRRWMITAGAVTHKQEVGEGQTTEVGAGGTRDLFERVKNEWKTGFFFTLGARLY